MDMDPNVKNPADPSHMLAEAVRNACVLMHVRCTKFGLERTDKQASKKANADAHAASDAGRVVVNRLAGARHLHDQIDAVQTEIRDNLKRYSMPWGTSSDNARLMPNANIGKWAVAHKRLLTEYKALKDKLLAEAAQIIAESKANRGNYTIPDFSVQELVDAYTVEHRPEPVPNQKDFGQLPEGVKDAFQRDLEARIHGRIADAKADTVDQMKKLVGHMVGRFAERIQHEQKKAAGTASGKAPQLYDSVIENIKDMAEVWGSFNITKDPRMDEIGKKLQRLTTIDVADVKKNTDIAEAAIKDGEEIMKDLDDLLIPGFRG